MNDLNSVFLVGRVKSVKEAKGEGDNKILTFSLVNNNYSFNETSKEYEEEQTVFSVKYFGKHTKGIQSGFRIGVNGRVVEEDGKIIIRAYAIQILDVPKKE